MRLANLRKVGEAVVVDIPPDYLARTGLQPENSVSWEIEGDRLVLRPAGTVPEYTLDGLLAQCDLSEPPTEEDREWTNSGPVGSELI